MASDDPDLSLVLELQGGSETALNGLMERHREPLFRFIFRYVLNEEDAGDLLQETFVRVYFKRDQFRPQAKFSTWLYRIALNLCRDHARSKSGRQKRLTNSLSNVAGTEAEKETDFPAPGRSPSQEAEQNEALLVLEKQIQALPHDLKITFILTTLEDRPHQEVAELLGITPKAVETRLYRARKLLAGKLRERWRST
jgi:RNA polymerase sigma factor CnrH